MRCVLLLVPVALAGCTQSPDRYPSLLPRPIETQSLAEPERLTAVATPDATLDARIAEITGALQANDAEFRKAAQEAEAKIAVARGLPEGSEGWLDAQAALSTLDTLRAPGVTGLADLERLATEHAASGRPPYPALDTAVSEAEAMSAAQAARITGLEKALAGD
jgi:hypothetical protein